MAVDYKMTDTRWKNKPYTITGDKSQTIGKTGCGPTSAADVIATFCDKTITPVDVAEWFVKFGFRTKNSGTAYKAFPWLFKRFKGHGLKKYAAGKSLKALKSALDQGALVICSMGPGYWTKGGHFIVAHKMDDTCVYALDPGSKTRKKQEIAAFGKQCKRMFAYWPE